MSLKISHSQVSSKLVELEVVWKVTEKEYENMNSQSKVDFTCRFGHTWQTQIYTVYRERSNCPECARPSSEASCIFIMENLLGKRFKKTRRVLPSGLELDGYNPELMLAVEYNGSQHYVECRYFHRTEGSFESQQVRDQLKREECIELGIELITVHYKIDTFNKIRKYIESELLRLGHVIDTTINWEELKKSFRREYDPILDAFKGIKELVEERNGTVVSTNYVDRLDPMLFKCEVAEHPEFEKTPADIRRGVWCNQCAHNAPLDDKIHLLPEDAPDLNTRLIAIRKALEEYIESGVIEESMIPIINEKPIPGDDLMELLLGLDPCGAGSLQSIAKTNDVIAEHMPCCRLLSYFGKVNSPQFVVCLRTMIVFVRSRDNCKLSERKCPMCVFQKEEDATKHKFDPSDPWASFPIYEYCSARPTPKNPDPLKFIARYDNVQQALKDSAGRMLRGSKMWSVLTPLRYSLFQCSSGFFAGTEITNRAKFRGTNYASFYPPTADHLDESNQNWILKRRLKSDHMCRMGEYLRAKYLEEKEKDVADYNTNVVSKRTTSKNNPVIRYEIATGTILERFESRNAAKDTGRFAPNAIDKSCARFKLEKSTVDLSNLTLKEVFLYEHDNQLTMGNRDKSD